MSDDSTMAVAEPPKRSMVVERFRNELITSVSRPLGQTAAANQAIRNALGAYIDTLQANFDKHPTNSELGRDLDLNPPRDDKPRNTPSATNNAFESCLEAINKAGIPCERQTLHSITRSIYASLNGHESHKH